MKPIKNLIFDFGTVLLNIDYQLTARAFEELGIPGFIELFAYKKQHSLFDNLEKGLISENDFFEELRKLLHTKKLDHELKWAWNAILLDLPKHRVECLRRLKQHYKLYLLSNTNAIHVESFTQSIIEEHGEDLLANLFEKCYYSNEIHCRKPDAEIYEYVLMDAGIQADESLFIDDLEENVAAAEHVGIQGYYLPKGREILELEAKLLK